jgi:hypothetical protein
MIFLKSLKAQGTVLGRLKGSKDSKPRPKGGYYLREMNKRTELNNNENK